MQHNYNVIILGGGLAGLTLAFQLKKSQSNLSILVLEKRAGAAPDAAHKVGESTVELGTYYLREVLGLKNYLEENHLHKHGLRFFFSNGTDSPIEKRVEYGARNELFVPSHQIDRGLFENDIEKMAIELGIDVQLNCTVREAQLSDEGHSVTYTQDGIEKKINSNWVVDATGRTNFIKRKIGLKKDNDHNINSVWFRVEGEIDINDWSDNNDWTSYINPGLRRLGTVHFMGKGYWVWFIPLSTGNTSIGIVADPRFHDFNRINKLEKAFEWLEEYEPLCARNIADKKDKVLDFRVLKNYSYNTQKFYSEDKWGTVGEAGAFLDPFYSPGTDFISLGNSWLSDLIIRDFNGEDVYTRTLVYDKVHAQLFNNWQPIYQDKYELFGNAQVMSVKITWDFAVYWAIPCLIFTNKGFTNMNVLKKLFTVENSFGERFGKLNQQVQAFFLDWGRLENHSFSENYVDPMSVAFLKEVQRGLEVIHNTDDQLIQQLEENLSNLEKIAAELFRSVSAKTKGTREDLAINPYSMSLKLNKSELIDQANCTNALPYNTTISEAIAPLWLKEKAIY